ncbi:MAG: acetyltransferase [Alphaproteobacteria bacterium]|nr:acetyltransferase [Alphaproteobacteria bacterium]
MTRKAVIFGGGLFAEVVRFYLDHDSAYEVAAFSATADSKTADTYLDLPVVAFEEIEDKFPPSDYAMFVAVGYRKMNKLRQKFCEEARAKGYDLLSYVCSKATHWGDTKIGDNVFVFEDNTIQPFVSIGDGTILWSGNHIGHHAQIGRYSFITSHVVISGNTKIGDRCFVGVNAAIADSVTVADDNLIGPRALIQKNTEPGAAYFDKATPAFPKPSDRFFR